MQTFGPLLTQSYSNPEEWTSYVGAMLRLHGCVLDFDVGEPIEAWLDAGEWFIPTSWSKGEGEACLSVGEPLPFFLERQAQ